MEMENNFDILYRMHTKNDLFYKQGLISKKEFVENNLLLINELKNYKLTKTQLNIILESVMDEFSIVKFKLGIQALKVQIKN